MSRYEICEAIQAANHNGLDGVFTSRQIPLRDMRRAEKAGLVRCAGQGVKCDGDGYATEPEQWADIWELTEEGRAYVAD